MKKYAAVAGALAVGAISGSAHGQLKYEGFWFNDTFGSTGFARMDLVVTVTTVTMSMDLDGFVFGLQDPDPLVLNGTVDAALNVTFPDIVDPFYGTVGGTIDSAGNVDIDMLNAGAGTFARVELSGSATLLETRMRYDIFPTGNEPSAPINGRIELDFVPAPSSFSAVGVMGLLCGVRRRRVN